MFPLLRLIGTAIVVGAGATIGSALAQRFIKRNESSRPKGEGPVIDGTYVDLSERDGTSTGKTT